MQDPIVLRQTSSDRVIYTGWCSLLTLILPLGSTDWATGSLQPRLWVIRSSGAHSHFKQRDDVMESRRHYWSFVRELPVNSVMRSPDVPFVVSLTHCGTNSLLARDSRRHAVQVTLQRSNIVEICHNRLPNIILLDIFRLSEAMLKSQQILDQCD